MTSEDIIRMVREAKFSEEQLATFDESIYLFAYLVAEAERERIVEILRDDGWLYCATMIGLRKK